MRLSAYAVAGSSDSPLKVIAVTPSAMRSRKVSAPGVASKRSVVREPKVFDPFVQVEIDGVMNRGRDDARPFLGFDAGKVCSWHGSPYVALWLCGYAAMRR